MDNGTCNCHPETCCCPDNPSKEAVALEKVRALLQRRIGQWRASLPSDPSTPGTRAIRTIHPRGFEGETDYNNDIRIYREAISVMDEALFLANYGDH